MTTATTTPPNRTASSETAYRILKLGFTAAPVLFGLDKFFGVMTDWTAFLPDFVTGVVAGSTVMAIVGLVEIAAGIGVWFRPRLFAWVVAGWLGVIIVTLVLVGGFLDVALRDFGLLLGAVALAQLAHDHT